MYVFSLDTAVRKSGKTSVLISLPDSHTGKKSAGLVNTGLLPRDFNGHKTIKITGYIKTENLAGGTASLWMEHKSTTAILAGVNSDEVSEEGSNDWQKHTISLPIGPDTQLISFGCKMTGSGKAWFDAIEIELDDATSL